MFKLPPLPYAYDALEPVVSGVTMRTHHDKHHRTYVETLNKLLEEKGERPASLEDVVRATAGQDDKIAHNAGQAWNHGFFWESMGAARSAPDGALAAAIERAFGDFDTFKDKFVAAGAEHFGSGWAWLLAEGGELRIETTHDGDSAIALQGVTPVLVCDLWEHAYYLDYRNDRKGFLEAWTARVANWGFAGAQYEAVDGQGAAYRFPTAHDA